MSKNSLLRSHIKHFFGEINTINICNVLALQQMTYDPVPTPTSKTGPQPAYFKNCSAT